MPFNAQVVIDYSFVPITLDLLKSSNNNLKTVISHPVAKMIFSHASEVLGYDNDIYSFWNNILEKEKAKGKEHVLNIESCFYYVRNHSDEFIRAFDEIHKYLPSNYNLNCKLYLGIGYDIGISYKGNAMINIGNSIFHENNRELLFFAMHELHHVGFFSFQPLTFSLRSIKTTRNLIDVIKYLTHLEGLATYAPFSLRRKQNELSFFDYQILTDPEKRKNFVSEYFQILSELEQKKDEPLEQADFDILEVMSGQNKRLWYVTGCHMAEEIDKHFGREILIQTILDGSRSFFDYYFKTIL
ncbi:MAG: DUF5700 domain-containing putative Zn-dependent protease [Candidatus Heimdallarchaeaceae archaeon]